MTPRPPAVQEREDHVRACYVALARLEMLLPEYRRVAPACRTYAAEIEIEHLRRVLDDPELSAKDARAALARARRQVHRLDRTVRERTVPRRRTEPVPEALS